MMKKIVVFLLLVLVFACGEDSSDFSPNLSGTGVGGSLAKFTISNNQVIVLNGSEVKQFDILSSGELSEKNTLQIFRQLETIFPYEDKILIGSSNAVYFLGFDSEGLLSVLSTYDHLTACDPVVASNGIAFSTLKVTDCRAGSEDLLEAIDISDIANPRVLRVYDTQSPFGLAIRGSFLFVCEKGGLTMYSFNSEGNLTEMDFLTIDGAIPLDIIVNGGYLIVRTSEGIYNVSYSDTSLTGVLGSFTTN
ncbi:hypothetical protein [Roseivirga sp.]|uniref:hypothetical protein n=1 Tax=Roseivirga sp. TaxID=1964215 RepID=UPI003B8AE6D2